PCEICRVYDAQGKLLDSAIVPFARSVAGTVVTLQEPYVMKRLDNGGATGAVELQPFEQGRMSVLAAPMGIAPGIHVVLELFDNQKGEPPQPDEFTAADCRLVAAAADFGAEMLKQAFAERQVQRVVFDALGAAAEASDSVAATLRSDSSLVNTSR